MPNTDEQTSPVTEIDDVNADATASSSIASPPPSALEAIQKDSEAAGGEFTGDPADADSFGRTMFDACLLYTSPSPRDQRGSRMPSSA